MIHEFQLKLSEDSECAELRDALNLALLHMQKYYRTLRNRVQKLENDRTSNGNGVLGASFRGLSPMTPFKDAPDKFQWKWINLDTVKLSGTLPADVKDMGVLPKVIQAAKIGDNNRLMQFIDKGKFVWHYDSFTLPDTKTDTGTDNMCTEPNRNLHWSMSLGSMNTSTQFITIHF